MAAKFLSFFPKPLLDDLVTGRWLPVVGAGMSLNAVVPPGKKMPLWSDLSKRLAEELSEFEPSGILDAISAYEHEFGRARLIERLSGLLLVKDSQPGDAHKAFCSIPFDIVCTTNFDFLLERQYDLVPRYVYPVIDEEQLSLNVVSAGTLLLKLHGDLHHPSRLIVTEGDYDSFLATYPLLATYIANQLISKTAVLIGYSLDDPDFRQIWHVVTNRLGRTRRMAYAILVGSRPSDLARFERRGVKVISLPGSRDKYGEILAQTFKELREYMMENVISVSKVTEEKSLQQLLLPRNSTTRLCFFSLPLELLPFYRERVFPLFEEMGFVPVTSDDVVTPGENITAKIDALIDRASVVVVDLTSQWTSAEYDMAVARARTDVEGVPGQRRPWIIVVVTAEEQIPPSALEFLTLKRPNVVVEDPDQFLVDLRVVLQNVAKSLGIGGTEEPRRLFSIREYRAAVISAMTLFESAIRERLGKEDWRDSTRPLSLRGLIDRAGERDILDADTKEQLKTWVRIRNEAVHTPRQIGRAEANAIVEGVLELIYRIRV